MMKGLLDFLLGDSADAKVWKNLFFLHKFLFVDSSR
jgi:hypothetical protein